MWEWIIVGAVVVVVGISYRQHRAQAGTYRSHSSRQPTRPSLNKRPLGTEALDLDLVNSVQRRNESLERANTSLTRRDGRISGLESAETYVQPMADDETYAKRFYAAFNKSKDSQ